MKEAKLAAERSTCISGEQKGCVILDANTILGFGYNSAPKNCKNCIDIGECSVEEGGKCIASTAEVNAITACARRGIDTNRSDIYCTHTPDEESLKIIINSGVKKVFVGSDEDIELSEMAKILLSQSGVDFKRIKI